MKNQRLMDSASLTPSEEAGMIHNPLKIRVHSWFHFLFKHQNKDPEPLERVARLVPQYPGSLKSPLRPLCGLCDSAVDPMIFDAPAQGKIALGKAGPQDMVAGRRTGVFPCRVPHRNFPTINIHIIPWLHPTYLQKWSTLIPPSKELIPLPCIK